MATATIPAGHAGSVKAAAWGILLGAGGISVTYNVYHAVHGGQVKPALAYLLGIGPVFVAMCLSHIVAEYRGGKVIKGLAFAVMGGAMGQSIGAIVAVVRPADGPWMGALFGCVLDAASLIALFILLQARGGKAAEATALETAEARAGEAAARAITLDADLAASRDELAAAGAELATVRAELATARERNSRARKSGTAGGTRRRSTAGTAGGTKGGTGPGTEGGTDDLSMEARALAVLDAEPSLNGAALAARLGITDGYGRRLRRKLTASVADPEA
jgi:hypothetical protein